MITIAIYQYFWVMDLSLCVCQIVKQNISGDKTRVIDPAWFGESGSKAKIHLFEDKLLRGCQTYL